MDDPLETFFLSDQCELGTSKKNLLLFQIIRIGDLCLSVFLEFYIFEVKVADFLFFFSIYSVIEINY